MKAVRRRRRARSERKNPPPGARTRPAAPICPARQTKPAKAPTRVSQDAPPITSPSAARMRQAW